MADFDLELRNSIRELQTAVRSTNQTVETTNRSLRQMQIEVKAVAAGHREAATAAVTHGRAVESVTHEVHGLARGAKIAGGEGGHLVHQFLGLAAFNPIAIAAGAGLGFVVTKAAELGAELIHDREEVQKLGEAFDKLPARMERARAEAEKATLKAANPQEMRKRGLDAFTGTDAFSGVPDEFQAQARAAARLAVESGRVGSEDEAVRKMVEGGAFRRRESALGTRQRTTEEMAGIAVGLGNEDPQAFFEQVRRFQDTTVGKAASAAEGEQTIERALRNMRNDEAVTAASGQASPLAAKLDTLIQLVREQNDIRQRDARAGATSTIQAAALARTEQLSSAYDATLAQIAVSTK